MKQLTKKEESMRPYNIKITWLDYNPTAEDDVYEVTILDADGQNVCTSWTTTGDNLGSTITKYMETSR